MVKSQFDKSVEDVKTVNLNSLPEKEKEPLLAQALTLFAKKYPEFSDPDNDDLYEDLSSFFDTVSFVNVSVQNGVVIGMVAGAYSPAQTASLTYYIMPEDKKQAEQATSSLIAELASKGTKATYIELYKKGEGPHEARDNADREFVETQGGYRVPFSAYRQPISEAGEDRVENLELTALFDTSVSDPEKSKLTKLHMDAFTKAYDPKLKLSDNTADLKTYTTELAKASWELLKKATPAAAAAPKPKTAP